MKKNLVILIILICIISPAIIIIFSQIKQEKNDITIIDESKIYGCYNSYYGHGEKVEQGYATLTYAYLLKNTKNKTLEFEIDWGDESTITYKHVSDISYVPHKYNKSGTYFIKVRCCNENKWSEPFIIEMINFYDINIKSIYSKPLIFRPKQKISLCVDLENIGNIPTSTSSKVILYYIKDDKNPQSYKSKEIIAECNVGIIQPGCTETVEVLFKWFNDKKQHTIFVEVQEIDNERTSVNNIKYEDLASQSIFCSLINFIKSKITGFFSSFLKIDKK